MSDIYGMGEALMQMFRRTSDLMRRTGRTTKLANTVMPGDIVVFRSTREAMQFSNVFFFHKTASSAALIVVDPESDFSMEKLMYMVRGRAGRVYLDHNWVEKYYMVCHQRAMKDLEQAMNRVNNVNAEDTLSAESTQAMLQELKNRVRGTYSPQSDEDKMEDMLGRQ